MKGINNIILLILLSIFILSLFVLVNNSRSGDKHQSLANIIILWVLVPFLLKCLNIIVQSINLLNNLSFVLSIFYFYFSCKVLANQLKCLSKNFSLPIIINHFKNFTLNLDILNFIFNKLINLLLLNFFNCFVCFFVLGINFLL